MEVTEALSEAPLKKVTVWIVRLPHGQGLPLPSYATAGASGMDLLAANQEDISIPPMGRALVPTGISVAIPPGLEIQVRSRSGLALKKGVLVLNTPGTIDSDYRGEIGVILCNLGSEVFEVKRGDRIAQAVLAAIAQVDWRQVEVLSATGRGDGGFGSTGVRAPGA